MLARCFYPQQIQIFWAETLLEPSESTSITLTVGAFGQRLPFTTNFFYLNPETKKEEKKMYEWKVQQRNLHATSLDCTLSTKQTGINKYINDLRVQVCGNK